MQQITEIINNLKQLSGNAQIDYLKSAKDTECLKEILWYTYNPMMQYGIKEAKFNKINDTILKAAQVRINTKESWNRFKLLLDKFSTQQGIKDEEIRELCFNIERDNLFKGILFKDLRISMGISSFNKVWEDFYIEPKVMLAEEFNGVYPDDYLISRKLDGKRGYFLNGKFYSRTNKEFKTANIQHIIDEISQYSSEIVFDGEFVYIDENGKENFSKTGIVARDEYTEESKNIKFAVFYSLDRDRFLNKEQQPLNFLDGYNIAQGILGQDYMPISEILNTGYCKTNNKNILLVQQFHKNYSDILEHKCKLNKWEGLMILDSSQYYQYKRTKYLQKVKEMQDAEFEIIALSKGKGKYSDTLGFITVRLDDENTVDVGSGFTDNDRNVLWSNKEYILNNNLFATVKYFEKTTNKNGGKSLRFPIFKAIRDKNGNEINL